MRSLLRNTRSAVRLTPRERSLALRAAGSIVLVRALLRLLPYARARRVAARLVSSRRLRSMTPEECARALRRAARLLPHTGCLARALAAECLLRAADRPSRLVVGVRFDAERRLEAHAWVESHGRPVVGGDEAGDYRPLEPPRP